MVLEIKLNERKIWHGINQEFYTTFFIIKLKFHIEKNTLKHESKFKEF